MAGAAYHASSRLMRVVPSRVREAVATPGGTAWYWLNAGQRRAALDNYAAVLGRDPSDPEVARVARRAFQNYGRILMDFLLLGGISHEELVARMSVTGKEHVDAALARGSGAILAVPHMGSWDMGVAYAGVLGYPVTVVAERFPGSLNEAIVSTRERFGVKIIDLGHSAVRVLLQVLRTNGVAALACDLQQGPGITVRFFGRRAIVPSGPAALALKTGAPLVPAYVYSKGPGRYVIAVEPALVPADGETRESLMQRVIGRFEDFIRQRPDQWYAFRPMFAKG